MTNLFVCHHLKNRYFRQTPRRSGTVIAVVLVVIVITSLAVIAFSKIMLSEHRGSIYQMRQTQLRYLSESGIEAVRRMLMYNDEDLLEFGGVYDNIDELCGVLVTNSNDPREVGRFSVISPMLDDDGIANDVRYGLADESAKIDLRMVLAYEQSKPGAGREILLSLPGVDETIADSILDWLDDDDETREYGAETDYYESLDPPYTPRNGMIESLDELLLVNGMTPALLYGGDWNRNGLVDLGEPDPSEFDDTFDDSDGLLACGLHNYLTVSSAEPQTGTDGSEKINVNQDDLETLQTELTSKLNNTEQVNYIIAYRLFGTTSLTVSDESSETASGDTSGTSNSGSTNGSQSSQNSSTSQSNQSSSQSNQSNTQSNNQNNNSNSSQAGGNQEGESTEKSFDLSQTPKAKIYSVLDLVGGSLEVQYSGETSTETLESPFTEDSLADQMPTLLEAVRFNDGEYSRVNINEAPRAVLLAIPGITEEAAAEIIANRIPDPVALADAEIEEMQSPLWPILLEYVDLETMKEIGPYITGNGTIKSAQIVARYDSNSPKARLMVLFDTSEKPAKIVRVDDLSELGPGFSPDLLGVNQDMQSTFSIGNAANRDLQSR